MEASQNNWASLLMKYLGKRISAEELQELERQIAASPLKRAQFEEFTDKDLFMQELMELEALHIVPAESKRLSSFWWKVAAAVILLIAGAGIYVATRSTTPNYPYLLLADGRQINLKEAPYGQLDAEGGRFVKDTNKLIVKVNDAATTHYADPGFKVCNPVPGVYAVQLPDESLVKLNTASYLRIPALFNRQSRQVEAGGEAYMEIRKDSLSPFTIALRTGTQVKVVGTRLNISAYEDEPESISLLNGKLTVTSNGIESPLKEGQTAVLQDNRIRITTQANPERVVSWTQRMFDFTDVDMRTAFRELERYYGVQLRLAEPFPNKMITARYPWNYGLNSILRSLETSYRIQVERTSPKTFIVHDAP